MSRGEENNYFTPFYRALHPKMDFLGEWCVHFHYKVVLVTINKNAGTTFRQYLPTLEYGEDVSFCLDAIDKGMDIWCDPRIRVGHEKTRII